MQTFDSDGVSIAYLDLAPTGEGSGDPIVLILPMNYGVR